MQTGEQAGDDMQKEAFRTPEAVASIEIVNNNQQEIPQTGNYWPGDGSSGRYVSDFEHSPKIDH